MIFRNNRDIRRCMSRRARKRRQGTRAILKALRARGVFMSQRAPISELLFTYFILYPFPA